MNSRYKTSEFWFTIVSFIISGLFLLGVISDYDKEELTYVVTHAVESIILIVGQVAVFARYMSKKRAKEQEEQNISTELENYIGVDKTISEVNINSASLAELIQLPHIGTSLAQKIIRHRDVNGPFENVTDLMSVNGIGEGTYRDIEKYLTVEENHDNI